MEDGALRHLGHHRAAPPIASHAPEHPIALVGSLAKRFWSGIRVGYVRAPRPVVARLGRIKTTHDLGSSTLDQLAAARLLAHPDTPAFLRARDQDLRRRHDLVDDLVAEHLPAWRLHPSAGGLSRWVQLPAPVSARFSAHALGHGVAIAPAGSLSAGDGHADHVRLSVTVDQDALRAGIARLAEAWTTFPAGAHGGSGSP